MRPREKKAALVGTRVEALTAARDRLRGVWLLLRSHSGLEALAEPVEAAVDEIERALAAAHEESVGEGRRRVGGEPC